MRPRATTYRTLDGLSTDRDAIAWYWKLIAGLSSFMIIGGFLMLPATFEDTPDLRTTKAVVGVLAVALLTAGFSLTGLVYFVVGNPLFLADTVLLPCLASCALGLLTVFYNFLVFNRYTWNTPARLTVIAAAVSTIIYAGLLVYSQRKIATVKAQQPLLMPPVQASHHHSDSQSTLWQEPSYYENYTRNMWPTAHPPARMPDGYEPNTITEEEMQRQQMLMLLLQKDNHPAVPDPSASTYHIDWAGRYEEDGHQVHTEGYYAPSSAYPTPVSAYNPSPGLVRQFTDELRGRGGELQPWDGVWRTPARVGSFPIQQSRSIDSRETRRDEIERGR